LPRRHAQHPRGEGKGIAHGPDALSRSSATVAGGGDGPLRQARLPRDHHRRTGARGRHRHFENKLDLFVTLIDKVGDDVIKDWHSKLDGLREPAKRLETLLAGNPSTHEKGRGVYRVIFQAMTETEGDPVIAKAIRKHLARLHKFVRDELSSLQKVGFVRKDESAADVAWLLINVAVGYGMVSPLGVGGTGSGRKSEMERLLTDLVVAE
jgi:hypothetical protein